MNMDEKAQEYFGEGDFNCAESTLLIANDRFDLGVDPETMKLLSAFGGGMGCGKTCGALCGAVAAIGKVIVAERAHVTPDFGKKIAEFVKIFEDTFGSCDCAEVKPVHFVEGIRCRNVVKTTSELLEAYITRLQEEADEK